MESDMNMPSTDVAAGIETVRAQAKDTPRAKLLAGSRIETSDGTHIFYRDWGRGRPIVFLASWSLPSESWDYQMLPLSEQGFRTIAYDRRGHGRSSDPGGGYDFDRLADDLAELLTALDLRQATLVSFSMAAGEIVRYLTRHGRDRVSRIVLAGTTTPFLLRTADNPDGIPGEVFEAFRRDELMRDWPKWIDDNMVPFVTPETSPGLRNWIRQMALGASLKALVDCHRTLTTADFRAELPRIRVPTLLLHGDRDQTSPIELTARPTARLVDGAVLRVYENAPHGIPYTHTARFNADIAAFAEA
jgi:pimeloyl-ACP methyl ester carboxylesterase